MGTAENKAVQRRIIDEVINRNNLDLADELFCEEHQLHPDAPEVTRGPEGMKRAFAGLHEEFPDVRVEIEAMVAEGDMVATRLTFSGTHAPTGERATWPEVVFARFSQGKAVERWGQVLFREWAMLGSNQRLLPERKVRQLAGIAHFSAETASRVCASWSTALVSASSLFCSSFTPLPLWTLLRGRQYLNLVAHPDRAVFDYPRADTTATL